MTSVTSVHCNRAGCANSAPPALSSAQLCLDHFLDEAFVRSDLALTRCREGAALSKESLEWLLSDALATVKNLEESASGSSTGKRIWLGKYFVQKPFHHCGPS